MSDDSESLPVHSRYVSGLSIVKSTSVGISEHPEPVYISVYSNDPGDKSDSYF